MLEIYLWDGQESSCICSTVVWHTRLTVLWICRLHCMTWTLRCSQLTVDLESLWPGWIHDCCSDGATMLAMLWAGGLGLLSTLLTAMCPTGYIRGMRKNCYRWRTAFASMATPTSTHCTLLPTVPAKLPGHATHRAMPHTRPCCTSGHAAHPAMPHIGPCRTSGRATHPAMLHIGPCCTFGHATHLAMPHTWPCCTPGRAAHLAMIDHSCWHHILCITLENAYSHSQSGQLL